MTMTSSLPSRIRSSREPRRFAPLGAGGGGGGDGVGEEGSLPRLRGVIFDVDGTICLPQNWMFSQMRTALGIAKGTDILDHIHSLPTPQEQEAAHEKIRAIERSAMSSQEPQPGLGALVDYLDARAIPKGICTRNFDAPVTHFLDRFLPGKEFAPIVTRDFRPPKPRPEGIWHIVQSWGFVGEGGGPDARQVIMVGDSIDDMTAGYTAGAATVLLVNEVNAHLADHEHTDLVVSRLDELIDILENGFVGRIGRGEDSNTGARAEGVLRNKKAETVTSEQTD